MSNVLTGKVVVTAPGVEQVFNKVGTSVTKASASLQKLSTTSSSATQSMINLGRVVQDAPFGFIGIANNINPLLESFQRLRASSTSTGAAIKSFAGSLFGAGGLGLAVSIASSLLLVFSGNSKKAEESTEALKVKTEAAAEAQKEFSTAVNSAAKSVVAQAAGLSDLKEILSTVTNLTKDLTTATINQGVAQFLFDKKNVAVQQLLSAEIEKQLDTRKKLRPLASVPAFSPEIVSKNPLTKRVAEAKDAIREVNELSFGLENAIQSIFNKQFKGPKIDSKPYEDSFKLFIDKIKKLKVISAIDIVLDIQNVLLGGTNIKKTFTEKVYDVINKDIGKLVVRPNIQLSPEALANIDNINKMRDAAKTLAASFSDSLNTALSEGLVSIGQGIGNILSGNDFGKQFAQVFGNLFDTIGKALIKFGIVKSGIDVLLKNFSIPGAVAIGIGLFAIAAGQLVKNISGGRAAGGGVQAGQSYVVGEFGREVFTPNTGGTITANSAISSGSGFSGGISISGVVENILRGKDLVQLITLQNQSNNRLI